MQIVKYVCKQCDVKVNLNYNRSNDNNGYIFMKLMYYLKVLKYDYGRFKDEMKMKRYGMKIAL